MDGASPDSAIFNEAKNVFDIIDDAETFTFLPSGVKSELSEDSRIHDFITEQ